MYIMIHIISYLHLIRLKLKCYYYKYPHGSPWIPTVTSLAISPSISSAAGWRLQHLLEASTPPISVSEVPMGMETGGKELV